MVDIRRAKDALKENHSPELQFLPDNDTDDYTMAVVMINEEFAAIREEEQKKSDFAKENAKEMTKEIAKEIKKIMKENPSVNAEELAEMLNVSVTKIRYNIRILKLDEGKPDGSNGDGIVLLCLIHENHLLSSG